MNDPRRLSEDATGLELDLLRAGQEDSPPGGGRERAAIALGLATGIAAGSAGTRGAAGTAVKTTVAASATLIKAVAIGCATVATVIAAAAAWTKSSPPHPSPPMHEEVRSTPMKGPDPAPPTTPKNAPLPSTEEPTRPVPLPSRTTRPAPDAPRRRALPPPPAVTTSAPAPSIGDEIALLDRARAALNGGDPTSALTLVDEHDAKFKSDAFTLESNVLRIDALDALGRRAAALERADAFLAAHPNEPTSRHVRSVAERLRALDANP